MTDLGIHLVISLGTYIRILTWPAKTNKNFKIFTFTQALSRNLWISQRVRKANGFSMVAYWFSHPKMREYCLLTYSPRGKLDSADNEILRYKKKTLIFRQQKRSRIEWSLGFSSYTNWTLWLFILKVLSLLYKLLMPNFLAVAAEDSLF